MLRSVQKTTWPSKRRVSGGGVDSSQRPPVSTHFLVFSSITMTGSRGRGNSGCSTKPISRLPSDVDSRPSGRTAERRGVLRSMVCLGHALPPSACHQGGEDAQASSAQPSQLLSSPPHQRHERGIQQRHPSLEVRSPRFPVRESCSLREARPQAATTLPHFGWHRWAHCPLRLRALAFASRIRCSIVRKWSSSRTSSTVRPDCFSRSTSSATRPRVAADGSNAATASGVVPPAIKSTSSS